MMGKIKPFLLLLAAVEGQERCKTGWKTLTTNNKVRCIKAIEATDNQFDQAKSRTWSDSEKDCQKYLDPTGGGAHLVSVHSEEEMQAMESLFTHEGWHYWIGLRMACPTCDFTWSDHSAFDYANWREGEPNNVDGLENCVEMDGFGNYTWNDHRCDEKRSYICAYYVDGDPLPIPAPPSTGGCPTGADWILYGGTCYKFKLSRGFTGTSYRQVTFSKAEEDCEADAIGGTLALMKTPWHNAFVTAMVTTDHTSDVFVGITSQSQLGKHFIWMDDSALTYTQWRKLHPTHHDFLNSGERIGTVLHPLYSKGDDTAMLPALTTVYPGDWEDIVTGATNLGYSVCSVEASPEWTNMGIEYPNTYHLKCPDFYVPFKSACYRVVTQSFGFDQANDYCKSEGQKYQWPASGTAQLVTIWNDSEDIFFYSMVYEGFKYAVNDLTKSIWIGLKINDTTDNGAMTWIDDYSLLYTNWGAHEPNIRPGDNCGYIDNFMKFPKDWSWKLDNNCNTPRSFICKLDKYGNFSTPEDDIEIYEHLGDPMDCDAGWQTHVDAWHCFKASGTKVSYPEAKRQCESDNAYLASVYGDSSNNYVKSLLSNTEDGRSTAAWIGAERMPSGGWRWMDRTAMTWSNFEIENDDDDAVTMSSNTGMWTTKQAVDQNGYVCKKMRKFSNCVATTEFKHCGSSGINEHECHNLGCCWDLTKERQCFYAKADARIPSDDPTGHTAGFAAGITAMTMILIYGAMGLGYHFMYNK